MWRLVFVPLAVAIYSLCHMVATAIWLKFYATPSGNAQFWREFDVL